MTDADFAHLCRLAHQRSGLALTPEKAYLVRTRLEPVARAHGLASAADLLAKLRRGAPGALIDKCVEALATHESSFFRDGLPFELLQCQILPELVAARRATRSLRIWSAACSSGQEPYSIAILLHELGLAATGWRIEILATDFAPAILHKAREGVFSDFEVRRGLSPERLARWFEKVGSGWRAAADVRSLVTFREHNLLTGAPAAGAPGTGGFDVIFCRNVLIYFDADGKKQVLRALGQALAPDGALFLGSAETVLGLADGLAPRPGARGVFSHRPDRSAAAAPLAGRAAG